MEWKRHVWKWYTIFELYLKNMITSLARESSSLCWFLNAIISIRRHQAFDIVASIQTHKLLVKSSSIQRGLLRRLIFKTLLTHIFCLVFKLEISFWYLWTVNSEHMRWYYVYDASFSQAFDLGVLIVMSLVLYLLDK